MRRSWWVLVLGLVLVVAGALALVLQGDPSQGELGWFAYSPLDDGHLELSGNVLFLTRARVAGAIAVVAGLLVLAGAVGYRMGRRTASV